MLTDEEVAQAVREYFEAEPPAYLHEGADHPVVHQRVDVDIDGDGRAETCVAAGYVHAWAPGCVLILFRADDGITVVPVVRDAEGWRELEVRDLDHDGRVEIWSEWRVGSGGFLSVYVHRWDGRDTSVAFSCEAISTGMAERKIIEGTLVDDIVVWSRTGEHRPSSGFPGKR